VTFAQGFDFRTPKASSPHSGITEIHPPPHPLFLPSAASPSRVTAEPVCETPRMSRLASLDGPARRVGSLRSTTWAQCARRETATYGPRRNRSESPRRKRRGLRSAVQFFDREKPHSGPRVQALGLVVWRPPASTTTPVVAYIPAASRGALRSAGNIRGGTERSPKSTSVTRLGRDPL
jgi:hypothetical protein